MIIGPTKTNAVFSGAVVGPFCMDLAIAKAKEAGIGWVVAKGDGCSPLYSFKRESDVMMTTIPGGVI